MSRWRDRRFSVEGGNTSVRNNTDIERSDIVSVEGGKQLEGTNSIYLKKTIKSYLVILDAYSYLYHKQNRI